LKVTRLHRLLEHRVVVGAKRVDFSVDGETAAMRVVSQWGSSRSRETTGEGDVGKKGKKTHAVVPGALLNDSALTPNLVQIDSFDGS
jgi:hypothetical protein